MIRNSDIIDRMERNGDYGAASDFKDSLREHGHSQDERADRWNPADGAQYSYAGGRAEQAYEDLRYDERREAERQEEEMRLEQEQERQYYEQSQRQQEEEHFYQQQTEKIESQNS